MKHQVNNRTNHALTFDVEDWHQGFLQRGIDGWQDFPSPEQRNIERILSLLETWHTKATFFVLGSYAKQNPAVLKLIDHAGHEIATHGFAHIPIIDQSPSGFREDLQQSVRVLEEITGKKIIGHRAMNWSMEVGCQWALEILLEEGIQYDSSVCPTSLLHRHGVSGSPLGPHKIELPSGNSICEFPAQVLCLGPLKIPSAGGFYFRGVPLLLTRWSLRQSENRNDSGMVYLHPYDFDPNVPVLGGNLMFRTMRYYHLDRTERYLERLLKDFSFASLRQVLASRLPSLPVIVI